MIFEESLSFWKQRLSEGRDGVIEHWGVVAYILIALCAGRPERALT